MKRLVCRVLAVITAAVVSMVNAPIALAVTGEHEGFAPIAQTRTQVGERSQSQVDAEFAAIITDLVGAPIRLLDTNGTTTWTNQASTWGATDADTAMPLRFPGQYHDTETGLFYNLNRYYNPDTGRYITADPLGLAPSPNPHTYVTNPTTAIDPLGLSAETHGLHQKGTKSDEDFVNLASEARTRHILQGDATGGGHLWPGGAGKSPFPQSWSGDKIMHDISDIATDPAAWSTGVPQGSRTILTGTRDGVDIRVVVDTRTGDIITGFPTNVPRNP